MLIESKKISSNVTMYSADPIIYVVSNFISDQECDAFIIAAETNNKNGKERISNPCQTLVPHNFNNHIHEVSKRLSIVTKISVNNLEEFLIEENREGFINSKTEHGAFLVIFLAIEPA